MDLSELRVGKDTGKPMMATWFDSAILWAAVRQSGREFLNRCMASYSSSRLRVERAAHARLHLTVVAALALAFLAAAPVRAQTAAPPIKLVALGDSLTAGLGLPEASAFPAQLRAALAAKGHNVEIVNAGVSGDTASGGRDRLDWAVADGTDGVILELGANDALRGIDPNITRAALEDILTKLKNRNIRVLLCGMMAPPNYGADYAAKFNAIYPELAKAFDVPLYPFFLDGVASDASLNQADGMHPTAKGVTRIVQNILPTVEAFVGAIAKQKG